MRNNCRDYTFLGLLSKEVPIETPIDTLAYIISLVDHPGNEVANLVSARRFLAYIYDAEETVANASELLSCQKRMCPTGCFPQTPVMLTKGWSPISALLEKGWNPIVLGRTEKTRACASGIWAVGEIEISKLARDCRTAEDLFWSILSRVAEKAKQKGLFINIIAKPGWDYDFDVRTNTLRNMAFDEAQKADRVIWQRTPG